LDAGGSKSSPKYESTRVNLEQCETAKIAKHIGSKSISHWWLETSQTEMDKE